MANNVILNVNSNACSYGDTTINSNPKRKFFDWQRNYNGIVVQNPKSEQYTVPSRQMMNLFNGTRPTTVGASTAFDLVFLADSRYRFKYVSGTNPGLATDIGLAFTSVTFIVTVNANSTLTIVAQAGATPFTAVASGHTIYIYGPADGVVGAFNAQNAGEWKVLSSTSNTIVLSRFSGTTFDGVSETVTCSATDNMMAYLLSVVQVNDKVSIDAGFQIDAQRTYTIASVTPKWFEVVSTEPLVNETAIQPGASGIAFYSQMKRFVRLETDQDAKVYFNGSTDEHQIIQPWAAADPEQTGWLERCGPIWNATVYNRSLTPMTVTLFSVE
jgi:hypothetical protein